MDAANVDLKAFTEDFYYRLTAAHMKPVLDTLVYLKHETRVWTEITTLLIPGHNDADAELRELCRWVARELGLDVPIHFTAFHPDYRMTDVPPTPPETLRRARGIALEEGLAYVYTGNVHDAEGDTTFCPACGAKVIERDWYQLLAYRLDTAGRCAACGALVAGCFAERADRFGRRRIPIAIGA